MRDILFKGLCPSTKTWVFGLPYESGGVIDKLRVGEEYGDFFAYTTYDIIPETLCAFTGRYDMHGEKIFENDIVKACDNNGGFTAKVRWYDSVSQFGFEGLPFSIGDFADFEIEVQGNAFGKEYTTE